MYRLTRLSLSYPKATLLIVAAITIVFAGGLLRLRTEFGFRVLIGDDHPSIQALDRFLGWEYEACCWRLRLVARRYISRRTGESDRSFSVQLQLRGFSDEGSSPEELLDRGTLGYQRFGNTL